MINLGDDLTADIRNREITLTNEASLDLIDMTFDQFDQLVAFVATHREGK